MRSFRPEKRERQERNGRREPRNFAQLGLDFVYTHEYSCLPRKEIQSMNQELFESLENRVGDLVEKYRALKEENARLAEEVERSAAEREGFKSRIDAILGKLDGI